MYTRIPWRVCSDRSCWAPSPDFPIEKGWDGAWEFDFLTKFPGEASAAGLRTILLWVWVLEERETPEQLSSLGRLEDQAEKGGTGLTLDLPQGP